MSGELAPWWVASAAGIVTTLAAVIGKLWSDHMAGVRGLRDELAATRAQLAEANKRNDELQSRNAELQRAEHDEHLRDLRRIAGLAASWPPPVISRKRDR